MNSLAGRVSRSGILEKPNLLLEQRFVVIDYLLVTYLKHRRTCVVWASTVYADMVRRSP